MLSVDWQVGSPVFFTGLSSAHTFRTGSLDKSSYIISALSTQYHIDIYAHSYCDQQRRPLDLLHICYRPSFVRLERPQHLEGRRQDADKAIIASEEEAFGPRANTADLVVLEKGAALVVWWLDLADFEEIECFPL